MKNKDVGFFHALIVMLGLFGLIAAGMFLLNQQIHVVLFIAVVWVACHAWYVGYKYPEIQAMMSRSINRSLPAIYIFLLIGLVIAALMKSGTVATLIYYGLDWLSPSWFLPIGFVLCSLMSVLTGTSWGTVGTLGVVFMGIGAALNLPLHWVAGMVVSGATFGDKMSPISDTTNLAAMSSDTDLYDHIKSMMMTTIPTFIIVLVIFSIVGLNLDIEKSSINQIQSIQVALKDTFTLNPLITIWPVVFMVVMSFKRVPAEITMTTCVFIACAIALLFQDQSFQQVADALWENKPTNTGVENLDDLLGRGGLFSMAWTLLLTFIAIALGGILQGAGFIFALLGKMVSQLKSYGSLVAATIATGLVTIAAMAEGYISIILTSRLYQKSFKDKGIDPSVLSRSVEESVTLLAGLIPWTTTGSFYAATLGIAVWEFAPYALLNLINPVLSIIFAYLGIAVIKTVVSEKKSEA